MNYNYKIEDVVNYKFESFDKKEFEEKKENFSGRITAEELANMPDDKKDLTILRCRISALFHQKFNGNYIMVQALCDIKENTFRRVLRMQKSRNITYTFLAKFCVGATLNVDEAKELFELMGHNLSEKNRYDYILLCELKKGCDIAEYDKDLRAFGYEGIFDEGEDVIL